MFARPTATWPWVWLAVFRDERRIRDLGDAFIAMLAFLAGNSHASNILLKVSR